MSSAPLAQVKAAHGSKEGLVQKIQGLVTEELVPGGLSAALKASSNSQLLRLHTILSAVKERFGTRAALVDALVNAEGRTKDADYKKHFEAWSLPRLLDAYQSADRRAKRAAKAAKASKPAVKAVKAVKASKPAAKAAKASKPAAKA